MGQTGFFSIGMVTGQTVRVRGKATMGRKTLYLNQLNPTKKIDLVSYPAREEG